MDSTLITRAISGIQSEGYSVKLKAPELPGPHGGVALGLTAHDERRVYVKPDMPESDVLAALLHEWTHVLYRGTWYTTTRVQSETEARLAAHTVLKSLGIRSAASETDLSLHYLMVGEDVLKASVKNAARAARTMLTSLEQREEVAA